MMIANNDPELTPWLFGISHSKPHAAGGFLRMLADTVFTADWENYEILRPALLTIKAKYPVYHWIPPTEEV